MATKIVCDRCGNDITGTIGDQKWVVHYNDMCFKCYDAFNKMFEKFMRGKRV